MRMLLIACCLCHGLYAFSQTDSTYASPSHLRDLQGLGDRYDRLGISIQQKSLQALRSLASNEDRLRRQLVGKDSLLGVWFGHASDDYQKMISRIEGVGKSIDAHAHVLREYLPGVDSMETALGFLGLDRVKGQLQGLQGQLQAATEIGQLVRERQRALEEKLNAYGLQRKLLSYKRRVYYFRDQIKGYKDQLREPDKAGLALLAMVRDRPVFREYFLKHSYFSTLFRMPGGEAVAEGQALPGLQTRSAVNAAIAERLGPGVDVKAMVVNGGSNTAGPVGVASGGGDPAAIGRGLAAMQDRLGTGSGDDAADFRPNAQHNKTFFKRLQLGVDVQTQSSTPVVPAVSTLAFSVGYRLSEKGVVSIGAGYKLGWGQPFEHIKLSSEGAALRSFIDWKLKGSIWMTGGYELNYLSAFSALSQLRDISCWQSSGLVGLMKTYKAGKTNGNLRLLFDALYRQHIPQSPAILFRLGYTLN